MLTHARWVAGPIGAPVSNTVPSQVCKSSSKCHSQVSNMAPSQVSNPLQMAAATETVAEYRPFILWHVDDTFAIQQLLKQIVLSSNISVTHCDITLIWAVPVLSQLLSQACMILPSLLTAWFKAISLHLLRTSCWIYQKLFADSSRITVQLVAVPLDLNGKRRAMMQQMLYTHLCGSIGSGRSIIASSGNVGASLIATLLENSPNDTHR